MFFFEEDVYNEKAAQEVLPYLFDLFAPKSVIDFGCGLGTWLKVADQLGANSILGIDRNYVSREQMHIPSGCFLGHDLCQPLDLKKKFDLALCLEVAEHLPAECASQLVETLVRHSDTILFSAALPHQGGQGHLNEREFEYCIELFQNHGFNFYDGLRQQFWNNPGVEWWYKQNMFLVYKKDMTEGFDLKPFKNTYIHPEFLMDKIQEIQGLTEELEYLYNKFNAFQDKTALRDKDLFHHLRAVGRILFPNLAAKRKAKKKAKR